MGRAFDTGSLRHLAPRLVKLVHRHAQPVRGGQPAAGVEGMRWSLVLVHPHDTERPFGTSRWLDQCDADSVFHVRTGHQGDMARLVRILSGRAVGLVLGGGGARGFAHLGVLRALEELGIPVDMIGGTSIGAPIGSSARSLITIFPRLPGVSPPPFIFSRGPAISSNVRDNEGSNMHLYTFSFKAEIIPLTSLNVNFFSSSLISL